MEDKDVYDSGLKPMGELKNKDQVLVLVADDEENLLLLLKDNLEERGFQVEVANNGQLALEMSIQKKPDIFILDVEMPKLNGLEACKKIRSNPELKNIPILILSAYAQHEDIQKGLKAGANLYMTKPFKINELVETIHKILHP